MNDLDKRNFWDLLNITMEMTNKPALSKDAVLVWYNLLSKFEFPVIANAIDTWLKSSSKPPTPHDIIPLCKPNPTIFARLPSPLAQADNKRHVDELVEFVSQNVISKTNYRAWAKKIIANPKKYPDISLRIAKEAMSLKSAV
jgi:hypothetical protein